MASDKRPIWDDWSILSISWVPILYLAQVHVNTEYFLLWQREEGEKGYHHGCLGKKIPGQCVTKTGQKKSPNQQPTQGVNNKAHGGHTPSLKLDHKGDRRISTPVPEY